MNTNEINMQKQYKLERRDIVRQQDAIQRHLRKVDHDCDRELKRLDREHVKGMISTRKRQAKEMKIARRTYDRLQRRMDILNGRLN